MLSFLIYIYMRGAFNKVPDFFLYGHLKLSQTLEKSVCNCYISYEMPDHFFWFQVQINNYRRNWNTPCWCLIVTRGEFQKMQCGREDTLEERYLAWIEHQFLSGIRDSRMAVSLWGMMRCVGGVRKSIHQSWLAKGLGLGLLCWGSSGRDSIGIGQYSSNRVSGISTRTKYLSITPSLSQTIGPRWPSRQFLILPIVQTLLPVTFGYSLSSEAVVMRQLRRWKRLWRRSLTRSHKRTSLGLPEVVKKGTTNALQLAEITSKGTKVLCLYYQ